MQKECAIFFSNMLICVSPEILENYINDFDVLIYIKAILCNFDSVELIKLVLDAIEILVDKLLQNDKNCNL